VFELHQSGDLFDRTRFGGLASHPESDRSAGRYRVRPRQALAPVARELPERDDSNLLLAVPSHDRCADAVRGVAVVVHEGHSLAPQPELFTGLKSVVFHQPSSAVSIAT
jgi:hypothetical protein